MRASVVALVVCSISVVATACGFDGVSTGSGAGKNDGGASDGGGTSVVTGAGCGNERQTGIELCAATSMCPNVVVDTQAFPSCGFRIRGNIVDLVCGCSGSICSMGMFTTCAQAAKLLSEQTESRVCVQASEGVCAPAPNPGSSSSSSSGGADSRCDEECYRACGGGAACASVCNCD